MTTKVRLIFNDRPRGEFREYHNVTAPAQLRIGRAVITLKNILTHEGLQERKFIEDAAFILYPRRYVTGFVSETQPFNPDISGIILHNREKTITLLFGLGVGTRNRNCIGLEIARSQSLERGRERYHSVLPEPMIHGIMMNR